jgi:NAD(P)-dependent dehydrogenase (short-subunit alcohol dehydrogenase family)
MKAFSDLSRLDGRVAIVTGGAGHLGLAFGEVLVELGAKVVVVDREQQSCEARAKQLGADRALGVAADLSQPSAAAAVVDAASKHFGRIDVLVNNAAFTGATNLGGWAVPFPQQSFEAFDAALRVNLSACFQLAHAARPLLEASGHGTIVNVGSIYGVVGPDMALYAGTPMGNPAGYAASKGGLIQLTKYLATVLAPKVRVNALSPGGIERGQPAQFQERYVARTPLQRMGHEEDFKGALAFLASDLSAYVTGQNLMVDGGWTAW